MRQKLDDTFSQFLFIRVLLARRLKVFQYGELAQNFQISLSTLARYSSPSIRELSRTHARRQTLALKVQTKRCHRCEAKIARHRRCKSCTVLIHSSALTCGEDYCIDTLARRKIGYQGQKTLVTTA